MRARGVRFLVALGMLAAVFPAAATQITTGVHPNIARGFTPGSLYQFGDIAHIGLFNGSLSIPIPIGQTYKVDGGLSYGFTLSYKSPRWEQTDRITTVCQPGTPNDPPSCHQLHHPHYIPVEEEAGLGWVFSLGGRILHGGGAGIADPTYRSPDGADHLFVSAKLHRTDPNEPTYGSQTDPDVLYTEDGTYLRLTKSTCPDNSACQDVEFPDGTIRRFKKSNGLLVQMLDRFNNTVNVTYSTAADGAPIWTVSEATGRRTQTVTFATMTVPTLSPNDSAYYYVLKSVSLTAFNGTSTSYTFHYRPDTSDNDQPTLIKRLQPNGDELVNDWVWVPLLTRVDLPDGSSYQITKSDGTPGYDTNMDLANESAEGFCGHLIALTLPTLGRYEWDYQSYEYPSTTFDVSEDPMYIPLNMTRVAGIREQRIKDAAGTVLSKTRYTLATAGGTSLDTAHVMTNTVEGLNPSNDAVLAKTINYFSVGPPVVSPPTMVWEYGLPITREPIPVIGSDAANPKTFNGVDRYLSSKTYNASGKLVRVNYVRYEADAMQSYATGPGNHRVSSQQVVYNDENGGYLNTAVTDFSDFDGLGHYRTTSTDGDFASGNVRTTTTAYNKADARVGGGAIDVGTWNPNTPASGFTMLANTQKWLLNTYVSESVSENSQTATSLACFDRDTGFLLRKRVMNGSSAGANDIISRFTADGVGNVAREETFGGDVQSVATDALCGTSITSAPPTYRTDLVWLYGSLKTSRSVTPAGANMFLSVDRTIDSNTGLTAAANDSAGKQTGYTYDASGRLTQEAPPGISATNYAYANASFSGSTFTAAKVDMSADGDASIGSIAEQYQYDALGRLWLEKKKMRDNTWSGRKTTFDVLGRKATVSEMETISSSDQSFSPTKLTQFLNYDAFDRVGTIRGPDLKDTTFSYSGVSSVSRTSSITMPTGDTSVTTVEQYDRQNRLVSVTEAYGTTDALTTSYAYDLLGHLNTVTQGPQTRTFTYDKRGFLLSETHPELGVTGNGTVSYSQYDSRGHALHKTTGAENGLFDLDFEYDAAERLRKISVGGTAQKEFLYGESGTTNGYLTQTISLNNDAVSLGGNRKVTTTFDYDTAGRIRAKTTAVESGPSFTQNFTYNVLNQPAYVQFPTCAGCGPTAGERATPLSWFNGFLGQVGTFTSAASPMTYHPNGMPHTITHTDAAGGHAVTDTMELDNGIARTGSISVGGFCEGLSIQTEPLDRTVVTGSPAGLTVNAPGATTFQWYEETVSGSVLLGGQTTSTLNVTMTAQRRFWVRVGNGTCTLDSRVATVSVSSCATPDATISGTIPIIASASGTASVPSTSGATYAWTISGGTFTSPTNLASVTYTAGCSGQVVLNVTVTASCGTTANGSRNVPINSPTAVVSGGSVVDPGQPGDVNVTLTGVGSWTLTWSDGFVQTVSTTPFVRHPAPNVTTTYWLTSMKDHNNCDGAVSGSATVTIRPIAPLVTATASGTGQVNVTWGAIYPSGYEVWRKSGAGDYTLIGAGLPPFPDNNVVPNAVYAYKVRVLVDGVYSNYSNVDLATTYVFSNDPLVRNTTPIRAVHLTELRTVVNAVRALAGLSAFSFTDPTLTNQRIKAVHINEMRAALNEARQQLGIYQISFTDPTLTVGQTHPVIEHVQELRTGVK